MSPIRVHAAEFDRWAEPLDDNITLVLAENLSLLLGTERVIAYPWDTAHSVDYTVRARISRFGSEPGGDVVLAVSWMIHDGHGIPIDLNKAEFSEPRFGSDVVDTVAAMSRAVAQFSKEIARILDEKIVESGKSLAESESQASE